MTDKLSISVDFDKFALNEATAALDALAASADRAKAALDALFGHPTVTINIAEPQSNHDDLMRKVSQRISKGARQTDHRFRL
ncbi:hypothetical protein [Brucella rhizosphaerae]|uniref:Uncharacterized protein n=1 Tax=Brucella rhizosphaerae TaxID=571254 RepID=A0A256FI19_9HYPH|nr:hypothetical protein [Brucella rhizosphaerae]OYR14494.1 hypothetical protein CEV32_0499 [Brucella rhizosphaerae]